MVGNIVYYLNTIEMVTAPVNYQYCFMFNLLSDKV